MDDWKAFHEKAVAVMPNELLSPKRYWMGILFHYKSPLHNVQQHDLLWIKGHAKVTIEQIWSAYTDRWPGLVFALRFEDQVPSPDTRVKALNKYSDKIIVFHVVPESTQPATTIASPPPATHDAIASRVAASPFLPTSASPAIEDQKETGQPGSITEALLTPLSLQESTLVPTTDSRGGNMASTRDSEIGEDNRPKVQPHAFGFPFRTLTNTTAQSLSTNAQPSNETVVKSESVSSPLAQIDALPTENETNAADVDPSTLFDFDAEKLFKRECSQDIPGAPEDTCGRYLQKIIDITDNPEILEAAVACARKARVPLKAAFTSRAESTEPIRDATLMIEALDKLIAQDYRKPTVIGVFGNTGAGKSSVINALLDEDRLVPTNCMRACTSVVTEISWNNSTDPARKYRAEIEFISSADWEKELGILFKDLLDEEGRVCRESAFADHHAGIAWAKFHAAYPDKTKESLGKCSIAQLMREQSVMQVLDTVKEINKADAARFYTALQNYVDSKEKATGKTKSGRPKSKGPQMEFWPLIKVVKIYVRSAALSTGAVLVDLPGVHDSNAARAAVAQEYIKSCTGLWILAPITRAVDDKAAKTLLNDTFKRQLKYDGSLSDVTFICSKTDDISISESIDSLGLEDQIDGFDAGERVFQSHIEAIRTEISKLSETSHAYHDVVEGVDEDLETWGELQEQLEDGETVYEPAARKRKRGLTPERSRKRAKDDSSAEPMALNGYSRDANSGPLTEEVIKKKIRELKETKKNARKEKRAAGNRINELKADIAKIEDKITSLHAERSSMCILGRNEYSRGAIQQDFAMGIRELDQENAIEEDEASFNPDQDLRDYDEVARSLPVFCVSSRAYQKMCGRLQKDEAVHGFTTKEETEIPQLQAHCKKLTEGRRIHASRAFLLDFAQQINTFWLWASNDDTASSMTDEDKQKQIEWLNRRLSELENGFIEAIKNCVDMMKREISTNVSDKYPSLITEAIDAAPQTSNTWGYRREDGGLHWTTYRAVVNHNGEYQSSVAGYRDFNAELVSPITNKLANDWERTFQNRMPGVFKAYIDKFCQILRVFHETVEERARDKGIGGTANLALLKSSINTFEKQFKDFQPFLLAHTNELQREANRDFVPTIASAMQDVYESCSLQHGTGTFGRMKNIMEKEVDQKRHTIFNVATETVTGRLDTLCDALEVCMGNKAHEVSQGVGRMYTTVWNGITSTSNQSSALLTPERALKDEVKRMLVEIDAQLEPIAAGQFDMGGDAASGNEDIGGHEASMELDEEPAEDYDEDEGSTGRSDHKGIPPFDQWFNSDF
ncbi:hypothetical protein BS50DRAFT_550852 [Corynespora cassiicola Philippines]|uniref:Nuclear GTPase SLIP-GC n=1 Tax=Corynespora cassiicola Philippines TaxID=1448308 RepID=A0A2T2NRT7_CORCC|nr:hypothetical protein BS50DRAFT_550852 [Corynespora cassiicola Philippines]